MQDNKISISLTTVIIITVVVVALIVGLASFIVFNKNTDKEIKNNQSEHSTIISSESNEKDNKYSNINSENVSYNTNSNTTSTNTGNLSNSSTSNSTTGKSSSKQNPLSIGEWGIASKYASGEYVDVPVKVAKVTRGSSAAQEVKNYCESGSSIYKYEDAKEDMEWAVIEYSVDLTQMEKESSITLDRKITGTGDNTSIKYNGVTYIVSTMNMTSGYTKGEIVTCKFAVQLPIGCTDYLIVLGSSSSTQAFFIGE